MADLIRRGRGNPFTDLMDIRNEMDRLLSDTFGSFGGERAGWRPAVDVEEGENEFTVTAELPGINKEDINISITDNQLTISGEIGETRDVQEKNYHVKERIRGKFARGVTLPTTVDSNQAEASYEDGILTVRLPKAEEAKPKQIEIKSK